jgi:hypothetical protein
MNDCYASILLEDIAGKYFFPYYSKEIPKLIDGQRRRFGILL